MENFNEQPSMMETPKPMEDLRGIGGTEEQPEEKEQHQFYHPASHGAVLEPDAMSPQEMMQWANQSQNNYIAPQTPSPYSGGMPPEWLKEYMDTQPFTDPYHQSPMSGLDAVKMNKYLTEREKLKYLKGQTK